MKIRGGMLLARSLQEKGVEQVFTLSGGFCNPALEGFMACGIPVINSPHEQVAGHLADGFTRITRKPTVCLVGPEGFANAVPAMMEAFGERSPVIFITGSSTFKRSGAGGFKEINDVAIAAPLTKYSESITDGERIPEFVDRAYKIAISGYPGWPKRAPVLPRTRSRCAGMAMPGRFGCRARCDCQRKAAHPDWRARNMVVADRAEFSARRRGVEHSAV